MLAKFFNFKFTDNNVKLLFLTLVIFLAIPITTYLVISSRDLRSKAETPGLNNTYPIGVLLVKYFPTTDGTTLDRVETGLPPESYLPPWDLSFIRNKVDTMTTETLATLEEGSRYQAYKNPSATPSLDYFIVDTKEFLTPIPKTPFGDGNLGMDHYKGLRDINICDYVENRGVKEVWVWMYHSNFGVPVESHLSGPLGNIGNGGDERLYPRCAKSFTTYDYNYGRGTNEAVHNHGHQIEIVLKRYGDPMFENAFIGPFSTYGSNDGSTVAHRCGWTHTPPNTSGDYDYVNKRFSWTDCEDWKPDGSGTKVNINCDRWQCDEKKYHIWRWQGMPGKNNTVQIGTKQSRNWWDWIGDYDKAKRYGDTLTVENVNTDTTAPTPPTNIRLVELRTNKVTLSWEHGSESGSGIGGYVIRRNGEIIDYKAVHNGYTDLRPTPGSTYSYEIATYDKWLNRSGFTSAFTVNVPLNPDTIAPSTPRNLRKPSNATVAWDTSTDTGTGVYIYKIYRNGTFLNQQQTTTFWDGSYQAGSGTYYQISAVDYSGNESIKSVKFYPDGSIVIKPADINQDSVVNSADLAIVISTWGSTTDLRADINSDGKVSSADLAELISSWGN